MKRPFTTKFVRRTFERMKAVIDQCTDEELAGLPAIGVSLWDISRIGSVLSDVYEIAGGNDALPLERACAVCGREMDRGVNGSIGRDVRYCSPKCRQRAYRKRKTPSAIPTKRRRNEKPLCDASHIVGGK